MIAGVRFAVLAMGVCLVLSLSGCPPDGGGGEPDTFGPAIVEDACAADDGPALEFKFGLAGTGCSAGLADTGWLRIAVWEVTWDTLAEQTYTFGWDDDVDDGGGWYSADGDGWVAVGGWIEITDKGDDAVSGNYEITTDEGETVASTFEDVPYCDTEPLCG